MVKATTEQDDDDDVGEKPGRRRKVSWESYAVQTGILQQPGATDGSNASPDDGQSVRERIREIDASEADDLDREELQVKQEKRITDARLKLAETKQRLLQVQGGTMRLETGQGGDMMMTQGQDGTGDSVDAELAKDVAEMDEPKQRAFFDAYSKMQMLKNPNSMAMFLPGLLGTARASETSPNDVTKVGEAMVNAMKTGMEMTRKNGGGDSDLASVVLKLIDKLESRNESNPTTTLMQTIEGLAKAGLVYTRKDIIEMQKEDNMWRAKGGLGDLSPGHIELERLRMDQQVKLEEIRNSTQMELAKLGIETKRTDAIANAGERLIGTIGRTLADAEADELDERGYGSSPAPALAGFTPSKPAGAAAVADIEEVKCPNPACGKTITVPEPEKSRDLVCVHCNTPLHWSSVTK